MNTPRASSAQAHKHGNRHNQAQHLFWSGEGEPEFPIALANLVLHGGWLGICLQDARPTVLFRSGAKQFNVVLARQRGQRRQKHFPFETSATQVLFVQDVPADLRIRRHWAIVLDERLLFRTNEGGFVEAIALGVKTIERFAQIVEVYIND
jgi:hypothetical protein